MDPEYQLGFRGVFPCSLCRMPEVGGLPLTPFTPFRAVLHDPIEKRSFKADIVSGFFTLKPFMAENFFPFSQKLFVKNRVSDEIRIFGIRIVVGGVTLHKKLRPVNAAFPH